MIVQRLSKKKNVPIGYVGCLRLRYWWCCRRYL